MDKKFEKKVKFHGSQVKTNQKKKATQRQRQRIKSKNRKKKDRTQNRKNNAKRRKEELRKKVDEIIDDNVIVNFSSYEPPDLAYLYLAKGLNFVPYHDYDKYDLKYDTLEFLSRLACQSQRRHYDQNSDHNPDIPENLDIHQNLKPKSRYQPDLVDVHPVYEDIRTKLLNWVDNFEPESKKNNISPGMKRGKDWVKKMIKEEKIFVCKADKGGAILIMNYEDVVNTVENDLKDKTQFEAQESDLMKATTNKITGLVKELEKDSMITGNDRMLITGLNDKGNLKHNPEFRPQIPTV